jgi:addiction module RelE/StbE family toxin
MRTITNIYPTRNFVKAFNSLAKDVKELAAKKDELFKANPHDPRLRTHSLKGNLDGYWAYSVNHQYRILFKFINHDEVIYFNIGTHEIYR